MSDSGIDLHPNRFTVEKLVLGKTIETVRNTYGFDGKSFGRFNESKRVFLVVVAYTA
jgi:hypothetical protein